MPKRTAWKLVFALLVALIGLLVWKNSSHSIDPQLVGEWGITRQRNWLGYPLSPNFTLAADGTWTSSEPSSFAWPLQTWSVSGDEVHLRMADSCWPSSGSFITRIQYAFGRITDAVKGGRSLSSVQIQRYRKEVAPNHATWLIAITENAQSSPTQLQLRPQMDSRIVGQWSVLQPPGGTDRWNSTLRFHDDGTWTDGWAGFGCSLSSYLYFEDFRFWEIQDDELVVRRVGHIWPRNSGLRSKILGIWSRLYETACGEIDLMDATVERFRIETDINGTLSLVQAMPDSSHSLRLRKSAEDSLAGE